MPLPAAGTSTAFLSSVRPTHCSTSRASLSTSSSDFSENVKSRAEFNQNITNCFPLAVQVLKLTMLVDDFLDLIIKILPPFDEGV